MDIICKTGKHCYLVRNLNIDDVDKGYLCVFLTRIVASFKYRKVDQLSLAYPKTSQDCFTQCIFSVIKWEREFRETNHVLVPRQ